jgi:hypothetical protein
MKMKKLLSLILAMCMVLSTMGTVAFAEETDLATVNSNEIPSATVEVSNDHNLTFAVKFMGNEKVTTTEA